MKMLGLSESDLGLCEIYGEEELPTRPSSTSAVGPTFTTKIARRSISLENVREIVREAVLEGDSDWSKRKLVAQAAYEEWYFRKQKEIRLQHEQEMRKSTENQNLQKNERDKRQQQSREEFEKWLKLKLDQNKKDLSNGFKSQSGAGKREKTIVKVSKEVTEKALFEWNKRKEKEMIKQKNLALRKKDKEENEKKQKEEKKLQANKVFEDWKRKLVEDEKIKKEKLKKVKEELKEKISTKIEGRLQSFEAWKEIKDQKMQENILQKRKMDKEAKDLRSMQITERMYEAEKAYEEWIEKVDKRVVRKKEKAKTPWTPV